MEVTEGVEQVAGLALQAHDPAADLEQGSAAFGQRHRAATPVEQFDAEMGLQRLHLAGVGRLADVERLGGGGETAFAGHGVKRS